jgi:hypothetical protein
MTKKIIFDSKYRVILNDCDFFFLSWEHFSEIILANLIPSSTHWRTYVILTFYELINCVK